MYSSFTAYYYEFFISSNMSPCAEVAQHYMLRAFPYLPRTLERCQGTRKSCTNSATVRPRTTLITAAIHVAMLSMYSTIENRKIIQLLMFSNLYNINSDLPVTCLEYLQELVW